MQLSRLDVEKREDHATKGSYFWAPLPLDCWELRDVVSFLGFLPARRYASAGNSDRNVSVRPSVRLSRAGIVSKRRKLAA